MKGYPEKVSIYTNPNKRALFISGIKHPQNLTVSDFLGHVMENKSDNFKSLKQLSSGACVIILSNNIGLSQVEKSLVK